MLAAALIGGIYGRLTGFGERQLAVDEYYFVEGVDKIRKHGVPRFDGGGYYVQGLLPQYLTAASFELFGETNTALRLPALLFGLLVPLLAYRYARPHLPAPLALALSAALLASSWEIEFSRFGRMYTALQCTTLAFLYRFERSIIGPDWKHRYRAHGWVVISTLCHLQGAILAPLLFWPCLDLGRQDRFPGRRSVIQYFIATAAVAALVGLIAAFDFRRWGAVDPFPSGYVPPNVGLRPRPARGGHLAGSGACSAGGISPAAPRHPGCAHRQRAASAIRYPPRSVGIAAPAAYDGRYRWSLLILGCGRYVRRKGLDSD
jgi:hypothetical protein